MQSPKTYSTILVILAFLLFACGGSAQATEDPQVALTSAIGTMVSAFFGTQTAMVTPATLTPTATETKFPTPTQFVAQAPAVNTLTPTLLFYTFTPGTGSPTVTGTLPTATANESALAHGCSNLGFIRHVNYPDGTVMKPGQYFTKTWKVQNTGTCDWKFLYRLAFLSGPNMEPSYRTLGKLVHPGSWAELSVDLTAPTQPGTHTAYFRFSDGTNMFGVTLGVTIKVEAPTNTPKPVTPTNTSAPTSTPTNTPIPSNTPVPSDTPTITSTP
ncbi:MAG: hypothetical protein IT310_14935 [Anaerolineales bacterium]|nr:hypothetical protein [Anaerolineales bacterium]